MALGSSIGSGVGLGGSPVSPAAIIAGLGPHDWWDFADSSSLTLSGSDIDAVANKGTSADSLTHGSGVKIDYDGSKAVCGGSQNNYAAGASGDRDFLHNGTGGEVFIVHAQASATNEQFFIFTNDVSGSSIAPGVRLSSFQTGGVQSYISRVGYGSNHLFNQTNDGVLTVGIPVITSHKVEVNPSTTSDIVVAEDGAPVIEQADSGVLSSASHTAALKALVSYKGDAYGILIFDRVLNDLERAKLYKALRHYYGLERTVNLTCLVGASNAEGLGSGGAISPTYQGVIDGAYVYAHRQGNAALGVDWRPLEQAVSHVDFTTSSAGLDLALMHHLANGSGVKEFLVKAASSGSDLYAAWNPDDQPSFSAAWDEFAARLAEAVQLLRSYGFIPSYRGCVIGLGENDASASFRANDYADNQRKLNARIRSLTRADLPIVLIKCSTQFPGDVSGRTDGNMGLQNTVRSAQETVASEESSTHIYQPITTGSLAWNEASPNGIHFDMASLEQMGQEIAVLL